MLETTIILTALILGTITDLKKREVPDTLNYSLIIIGLIINAAISLINNSATNIINSITGLAIGFLIGAIFYYTGQWGGGDAKLIMGIGAIMGINPQIMLKTMPPFILFIITSLLVGAIYAIIWMIGLAIKNREEFKKEYAQNTQKNKKNTQKIIIIISTIILIILLLLNAIDKKIIITAYMFLALFAIAIYMKDALKAIEKVALIKKININQLTEGDWIIEEFKFKEKTIKANKTGISIDEINYLKRKGIKEVTAKQGIPFVPSFLITYLLLLITGNWLFLI